MNLRDHPSLSFYGYRNWPPVWVWLGTGEEKLLNGEIGVLREVRMPDASGNKLFLLMDHDDRDYVGCLLINDSAFCQRLFKLLQEHCGRSIEEIGSLDISHLL